MLSANGGKLSEMAPTTKRPMTADTCIPAMNSAATATSSPGPKPTMIPKTIMPTRNGESMRMSPKASPARRPTFRRRRFSLRPDRTPTASLPRAASPASPSPRRGDRPGTYLSTVGMANSRQAQTMTRKIQIGIVSTNHSPSGAPTAAAKDVIPPKKPRALPIRPGEVVPGTAALARTTNSPNPTPPQSPARTSANSGGPTKRPRSWPRNCSTSAISSEALKPKTRPAHGAKGWATMTPIIIVVSTDPPVTVDNPSAAAIVTIVE